MEALFILLALILLIAGYFCFGIIIKFLLGWLPLVAGLLSGGFLCLIGGWGGGFIGLVICIACIFMTDSWQGSDLYLKLEEKLDTLFAFKD